MPGAGTYIVGRSGGYPTLQAALDQLFVDQGTTPFAATQTILVYPIETSQNDIKRLSGGRVPVGLVPTETYRLVIQAGVPLTTPDSDVPGMGRPMLYGKTGTSTFEWAGIYVDQVDYVDILDFDIQEFKSGIIFYRSNYGRVISCRLYKNSFFGIQFFESDRGAVINTTVEESSACISMMRSRECVLIHNLLNTGVAGYRHCLAPEWVSGSIDSPTPLDQSIPIYYAFNNIFHCAAGSGAPLIMPLDIQKTLSAMDGNVYYSSNGAIADIFYTVEGQRVDTMITTMTEWRRITNAEANSIYASPGSAGSNYAGVIYESSSGIFNRGISLDVVKSYLPSWFVKSIIDDDVGGDPRDDTATPTPGPTEYITGDDYDIFADFLGATSDLTLDEDTLYGVDRAVRQLQISLECWEPAVAAGYFYVGDAAYYLYASKIGRYLQEVTWSRVSLPSYMEVRSVGILDTSECDDATEVQWMQRGLTVWANHKGATLSKPLAESVRVYGVEQSWDSSEQAFLQTPLTREFSIKDSPLDFFLETTPMGGGPIVITDDTLVVEPTSQHPDRNDRAILPMEYRYSWDESLEKPRLRLQGATNLFENPHLHTVVNNVPVAWEFGDVSVNSNPATKYDHQVIGRLRATVLCSTSYDPVQSYSFRQIVTRFEEDKDLIFSWYMRSDSGLAVRPVVTTYYDDGSIYSETILDVITSPGETSGITWDRHVVHCKADPDSVLKEFGLVYSLDGEVDLRTVNNRTSPKVKFELRAAGLGTSEFDAFMAFEGDYVPRYSGLSYGDEITVEYDSSDAGVHVIEDLSISPILNPQHTGFLTIGPVLIQDLDTSVLETVHTSLSDTYKPTRLRGLPWAKIDGPNKLRHVSSDVFGTEGQGLPREVAFQPELPVVKTIEVFPNPILVAQGLRQSVHVQVKDTNENPYANKDVTIYLEEVDGRFTGGLGLKEMGSVSKAGVNVTTKSDPSGSVVGTFIAAEKRFVSMSFDTSDLYPADSVETYLRPNLENHANVTLYRANTKEEISIWGDVTSEILTPVEAGRELQVSLTELPAFATLTLKVNGTSEFDVDLFESVNQDYADNEFYVDYATGVVSYKNTRQGDARATYIPMYIWVDTSDPNALQFHPNLVDLLTSDMIVQYDAMSNLVVEAGSESLTVPVVLLNPDA